MSNNMICLENNEFMHKLCNLLTRKIESQATRKMNAYQYLHP